MNRNNFFVTINLILCKDILEDKTEVNYFFKRVDNLSWPVALFPHDFCSPYKSEKDGDKPVLCKSWGSKADILGRLSIYLAK